MSQRALAVLIAALLLLQLPSTNQTVFAAPDGVTFVTLYAHATSEKEGCTGIMNALPQWGPQEVARLQEGEAVFCIDPPLGNNLTIDGTTTIRLWAMSDFRLSGYLAVYITAAKPDGTTAFTHPVFNDTVFLDTRPRDFNYLVAINNLTLATGSTVQLHVRLTSNDKATNVSLLYDNPATPSQMTLPLLDPTSIKTTYPGAEGYAPIFQPNSASHNATVTLQVGIVDALGLERITRVALNIVNSTGGIVASSDDILPMTVAVSVYNTTYKATYNLTAGAYSVRVQVNYASGDPIMRESGFYIAPFFNACIRIVDSSRRPVTNAQLFLSNQLVNYTGTTNQTGLSCFLVPSSLVIGGFDLTVLWKNLTVSQSQIPISQDIELNVGISAYDLTIQVSLLGVYGLPNAQVSLFADSKVVSTEGTNSSGFVEIQQLPPGKYDVTISYLGTRYQAALNVTEKATVKIQVPLPYQNVLPYVAIALLGVVVATALLRGRRVYRWPFEYMNVLTNAGVPDSHTTVIAGNTGSGKSVLMQSFACQSLTSGRGCVFVTNVELPSDVRTSLKSLGMDLSDYENRGKLIFIDCYSSLSGAASKEKRSIGSITDLTSLGIQITQATEEIAGATDVYFDSLTPLFTVLKTDYVLNFLQSVGAKVKSYNGGLCTTIGLTIEKDALTKVEEVADCVIETQLSEGRKGQKRRLRVKKLRGHPYDDSWTGFTITDQGIIFLAHKPQNHDKENHSSK